MSTDRPVPTMLRVYGDGKIGSTAFFRNRPLLAAIAELICSSGRHKLDILFHACSIGAEPYSFAAYAVASGLTDNVRLRIAATDVHPGFLSHAAAGAYPAGVLAGMTDIERQCFVPGTEGVVHVRDDIRAMIEFLPPASFVDFTTHARYDIVFLLNALTYVSPTEQTVVLQKIAGYNRWLLATTAFHPDTIRGDLEAAGYAPVANHRQAIHNAWVERLRPDARPAPGSAEYSWMLPAYGAVPDPEYRHCALFTRHTETTT